MATPSTQAGGRAERGEGPLGTARGPNRSREGRAARARQLPGLVRLVARAGLFPPH